MCERGSAEPSLLRHNLERILKVLITFALEAEFAPWRRARHFAPIANAGFPLFESIHSQLQIRAIITGVGPARAQLAAREALHWQPDVCIAAGFAGGLKPSYRTGEVLVAATVRDAESQRSISANPEIIAEAIAAGARGINALCTSDRPLASVDDKRRMGRIADAVDMESFFVLFEAQEQGIQGVAIRAVSDAADENVPMDFSEVLDNRGRVRIWRLVAKIVRAPQHIPALIRLGFASRRGAQGLAQVLDKTTAALQAAPGSVSHVSAEAVTA